MFKPSCCALHSMSREPSFANESVNEYFIELTPFCPPKKIFESLPLGSRVSPSEKSSPWPASWFRIAISTWTFAFAVLAISPLVWIVPSVVLLFVEWWIGLAYLVLFPLMVWYLVAYTKLWRKTCGVSRYVALGSRGKELSDKRERAIKEIKL